MEAKSFLIGLAVIDLLVLNAAAGYGGYKYYRSLNEEDVRTVGTNQFVQTTVKDVCGQECQEYVDEKIAQAVENLSTPAPSQAAPKQTASGAIQSGAKIRQVNYVTIPGAGSSGANDWSDLSGTDFYFDTGDYSGIQEITFEANMRLFNGNGTAYVRLFDVTHGIGVQGSEIQTTSQASKIVVSGKVSFWSGRNLVRVQAKSLTADTAVFDSGRIKIVTEN